MLLDVYQKWYIYSCFFESFLPKLLHEKNFCLTFAFAFETKQNALLSKTILCRNCKKKEFFEKIYINRQVVQEANPILLEYVDLGKIQTVNLIG